jgi:hypothetical protein
LYIDVCHTSILQQKASFLQTRFFFFGGTVVLQQPHLLYREAQGWNVYNYPSSFRQNAVAKGLAAFLLGYIVYSDNETSTPLRLCRTEDYDRLDSRLCVNIP